ncbi:MAG: aspartyl protease family protein, partial [Deltaproteobacteria bacterium]|nr:aspartyl protease family protein [Deltaproteobacteria bacterium]
MVGNVAIALLATLLSSANARSPAEVLPGSEEPSWSGPDEVALDLLRPGPGGSRIFVQATLPDGEPGLFLVDTGAAISALSTETSERLGLAVDDEWGFVEGLGGRAPLNRAVVSSLVLGEATLRDVEFAVGVRGIPVFVGGMPLDGILGNNVWSLFVVEIDYPADTLVLHRPGTMRIPKRADPMFFDGSHVFAPINITTAADPPHTDRVVIQVDTGASGLMLAGAAGRRFEDDYTEGVEPIFGIGANELVPASQFLQITRHVPVAEVELGGQQVTSIDEARWVNFGGHSPIGPEGLKGLAGHELLQGHVVILDYAGGRIVLRRSRRKHRSIDGHQVLFDQDVARYGDDPSRYLYRARMHIFMGTPDESSDLLQALIDDPPPSMESDTLAEARVLLAGVHRVNGDLEAAWEALAPLGAGELVDQGEVVAAVNGLLLEDRGDEALALAEAAWEERPEEVVALVARADALFSVGRFQEADAALMDAARLVENPDANLLRRSRIALAQGDRYGAMASIRKLLALYPYEGLFLWFYAELIDPETDADTFRHDMTTAMDRLHPGDRPLDFLVAAHSTLGEQARALELMGEGIERDCTRAQSTPSENNCLAWYFALADTEHAEALRRIDEALAETGDRSDFLDTKAMVHLSREEYEEAHRAAVAAARLSPDDVYMLWQAERLGQL